VARPRRAGARREALAAYAFIAPNYLLLLIFVLVPLVGAFLVSLQRTDGFGDGTFTGLDNYARLASDPLFWRSLGNTLLFTAIVTPLSMAFGLFAAVMLNSALPARPVLRSLLILPMAVSGVATALIGVLIFDQNSGALNKIAQKNDNAAMNAAEAMRVRSAQDARIADAFHDQQDRTNQVRPSH
jgi:multiple sugar transport system permease protein